MPDSKGRCPISVAVQTRNKELVALLLLKAKANPNVRCGKKHHFTTSLIMACEPEVNMKIVKLLVENKADVNIADKIGRTPIWEAVATGNFILTKYLLDHTEANPNIYVQESKALEGIRIAGTTPLIEACRMENNLDMVELLMQQKVSLDVNMADRNGVRPLSVAFKYGNIELVQALLNTSNIRPKLDVNYSFDINSPVQYKLPHVRAAQKYRTPLTQAVAMGDKKLAAEFIHAGADIDAYNFIQQNIVDYTPLMEAVLRGDLDMCTFLIENGSAVNAISSMKTHSKTALTIAVQGSKPDHLSITELLLQHGAIHPREMCGRSLPMYMALLRDKSQLVDLFLKNGYIFTQYQCKQNHAVNRDELCDAIQAYAEDCSIMLIQWGFDVEASSNQYFCEAIGHGMSRLTRILIQRHPQYLQASWLVYNNIPASCRYNSSAAGILEWIQEERMQPRKLQELCKATILHHISRPQHNISAQINKMVQLPTPLKQFLQM